MDTADLNVTMKRVDALPLVKHYIEELGLPALFDKYVPNTRGFEIPPAQVLCLLVANITMSARPLYQVLSGWPGIWMVKRKSRLKHPNIMMIG